MRLLSRLTIGKKCLGLSVVSSLLLLAVAGTGLWGIHSISASAERMLQGEANVAEHAAAARGDVLELRRFEKDTFLNCLDPKKVNEYTEKFNDAHASLAKHIDTLEELAGTAEDKQRILATRNDLKIYASAMATIFAEVKSGDIKALRTATERFPHTRMQSITSKRRWPSSPKRATHAWPWSRRTWSARAGQCSSRWWSCRPSRWCWALC